MPPTDPFRIALQRLGLGRHESAIYATLVERSPQGASAIARSCGLARSSVYTALANLVTRGLVGTTHRDGVKQFVAEGHAALVDALKREEEQAASRAKLAVALEPHFAARQAETAPRLPHVVHFEGLEGLKRVYLTMLRQAPQGATMSIVRDEFLWTPAWAFVSATPWRARVRALRAERNIGTRLLVNRSRIEESKAKDYRAREHLSWRYLPSATRIDRFAVYILGEIVAVMSTEEQNLVGIQIANRHLASNFGSLFDLLWTFSLGRGISASGNGSGASVSRGKRRSRH